MLYASWGGRYDMWAGLLREIFEQPSYDIPILQERTDLTIIDLGANIGVSLDYFNKNNNKVYGVEGSTLLYECIVQTKELNESWQNVKIHNLIVSDKNEMMQFAFLPKNATGSCREDTKILGMSYVIETVESVTFDVLLDRLGLKNTNIDLLKIDIEASEHFVLNQNFLQHDNISNIIVETHNNLHLPILQDLENKEARSNKRRKRNESNEFHTTIVHFLPFFTPRYFIYSLFYT
jgi:FkbM family methyltransferase